MSDGGMAALAQLLEPAGLGAVAKHAAEQCLTVDDLRAMSLDELEAIFGPIGLSAEQMQKLVSALRPGTAYDASKPVPAADAAKTPPPPMTPSDLKTLVPRGAAAALRSSHLVLQDHEALWIAALHLVRCPSLFCSRSLSSSIA